MTEKLKPCQNCWAKAYPYECRGCKSRYRLPDTNVGDIWNKHPVDKPNNGQEIIVYIQGDTTAFKGCAIFRDYPEGAFEDFGNEPINVNEGDVVYWKPFPEKPKELQRAIY